MGWNLAAGRGQGRYEGVRESGHTDIHLQAPSDGGTVAVTPAHIRSLRAGGYIVRGQEAETYPMVVSDGGGLPTEGYYKRYFGRRTGAEPTGIC